MLKAIISALVTRDQKVVRTDFVRQGNEDYGYCEDQWTYQDLVETVRFLGIPVWRRRIDREEVPQHVLIELGATGFTAWKSKFAAQISAQGWHYGLMNEIDPRTAPKNPLPYCYDGPLVKGWEKAFMISLALTATIMAMLFVTMAFLGAR